MSFVAACFVPTLQQTIYRTGVYRKALCQFFYANAFVVCFRNQFSSFIVQHSSHLLCLCYTSFFSKVKVLCCIIENCYIPFLPSFCKGTEWKSAPRAPSLQVCMPPISRLPAERRYFSMKSIAFYDFYVNKNLRNLTLERDKSAAGIRRFSIAERRQTAFFR